MNKNRIVKKSIFIIVLILAISSFVFAEQEIIKVKVNTKEIVFDVNPSIIDGRTVLPVRAIFEALGLEVGWDGNTKTVTGKNEDTMIILRIDDVNALVNDIKVKLDVPAMIIDGRTMVPARFVAESTGSKVNWNGDTKTVLISENTKDIFEGYTMIEVDGGNLSGHREANVVVDIGFGDREYYAFTNEYGQLVRVIADEIILQDEDNEPVLSTGRYYYDEAKVPGVESSKLDEGHVIADSLGGVANSYNITPQESTLNRHGDQAYMEKVIRDANGCTDFEAIITYPNKDTQIPSNYSFTYTLLGNIIHDEFDNINPDEANADKIETEKTTSIEKNSLDSTSSLVISRLNLSKEEIDITNNGSSAIELLGYVIVSVEGNQSYTFPSYTLKPNQTVTVYARGGSGDLKWTGSYIWNNDGDPAELYDADGKLIYKYE